MIDSIMALPPFASMPVDVRGRRGGGPRRRFAGLGPILAVGMCRGRRRIEAALGVDQEGALRGDLLAGGEPFEDREAVADAGAEDDGATLVDARLGLDVDDLLAPGV